MLRVIALIAIILLSSCAVRSSASMTRHGQIVISKNVSHTADEIDAVIEEMILITSIYIGGKYSADALSQAIKDHPHVVIIKEESFECGVNSWCQGEYSPALRQIKYAHHKCIAYTSLAHELAHMFHWIIEGKVDYNHGDFRFYGTNGIINIVNRNMAKVICRGGSE